MAEIKIEKKSTVWPWILIGLIVLALLLYFLVFRNNDNVNGNDQVAAGAVMTDTSQRTASGDTANAANPIVVRDEVANYVAYINNTHDMGIDHEYSSSALTMLTNAIRFKANQVNVDLDAELDQAKQLADKIKTDPSETTHANSIDQASEILTNAMQKLQSAKFPNLNNEMQSVKQASDKIHPNTEVLNQKDAIKGFFDQSAALLQKM